MRHLDWEGGFNVRDLGALPTLDGRTTRRGAVVRADALDGLTAAGWKALVDHGLRTLYAARGEEDQGVLLEAFLAERGTTAAALVVATLAQLDVAAHLRPAGLTDEDVAALRERLVGSSPPPVRVRSAAR